MGAMNHPQALQDVMWFSPSEGLWILQSRWMEMDPVWGEVHRLSNLIDYEDGYDPVEEGEGWKEL